MPPPAAYWSITVGTVAALVVTILAIGAFTRGKTRTRRKVQELAARPGMAKPRDITRAVGRNALLANRSELRPTLTGKAGPSDLGWRWGQACGVDVYTSVRDSVVLLGPSGAGKGVYVVNNRVLDAPGAVVVTSTRPDVVAITMTARARVGPVGVIAADGSVDGLPEVVAWSPIIGCRDGRVAAARAQVLAAGSSSGVEDSSFWQGWSEKVIKALLHAAAWGDAGIDELWRWSQSAVAAKAALAILHNLDGRPAKRSGPGGAGVGGHPGAGRRR